MLNNSPTKSLYWKEMRENWKGVALAPAIVFAIIVGSGVYNITHHDAPSTEKIDSAVLQGTLCILWVISAVTCSASMVAPEIGAGTITFLSSLPVSRRRIWLAKLVVGFVSMVLFIVLATAAFVLFYPIAARLGMFSTPLAISHEMLNIGWLPLALSIPLFSLGFLVTMLVDRTITAMVATVIASVAVACAIMWLSSILAIYVHSIDWGQVALYVLSVPLFLSMSYTTFVRGETLRTSMRFKVAIPGVLIDLAIIMIAIVIAVVWIMW